MKTQTPRARIGRILALALVGSSASAAAHAGIILSVGDSPQGSAIEYNSASGLTHDTVNAGDTQTLSTPGMPAGLNSAGITLITDSGGLAFSSADLAQGAIRAQANGGPSTLVGVLSKNAYSNTVMQDLITFHISDASPFALVGVHVHLDGTELGAGQNAGQYTNELPFSFGGSFDYYSSILDNGNAGFGFNGPSGFNQIIGWESYAISNASLTGFDFDGVIKVTDGQSQQLSMSMFLNCYDHTSCDFSHTGDVTFTLPTDVSYTSASGVFLTSVPGPPAVGAVPEPATWATMLVGFGGIGAMLRRRRRAMAPA